MAQYTELLVTFFWKGGLALVSPIRSYYPYVCFIQTVNEGKRGNLRDFLKLAVIFTVVGFQFYSSYFRLPSTCNSSKITDNEADSLDDDNSSVLIEKLSESITLWQRDRSEKLGLTTEEVAQRRKRFGFNETFQEVTVTKWLQYIWVQITTPEHLVLDTAILLLIDRRQILGALLCTFSLVISTGIDFWQQLQAVDVHRSIALRDGGPQCTVRNGQDETLPFRELVPGDVVYLKQGEVILADCRIVGIDSDQQCVRVDGSAITGDTTKVNKHVGENCYQSTILTDGNAWAVVTATGWNTFIGSTMQLVGSTPSQKVPPSRETKQQIEDSEYWEVRRNLGVSLTTAVFVLLIVLVFISGTGKLAALMMTLLFIPLPFELGSIPTIRAVGAAWLSKEGVIPGPSDRIGTIIDALAGIDTLCVTKTGTMTMNDLKIHHPWCNNNSAGDVVLAAYLSAPIESEEADPIAKAVSRALDEFKVAKQQAEMYTLIEMIPWDASSKLMKSKVKAPNGEEETYAFGAPRSILDICTNTTSQSVNTEYRDTCGDLATRGFRALGVARKLENQPWELVGILPMFDPPRSDSKEAVRIAQASGIQVQIVTGDAVAIASTYTELYGLPGEFATLSQLQSREHSTETEATILAGYAEVFPADKRQIISTLQSLGRRVAITGDSVADGPSLRLANCGVAVEGATKAAMDASDVVMLRDGLSSIVRGIQICRQIFRQTFCTICCFAVQALHHLIITVILFLASGHVFDLQITIACNIVNMLTGLLLGFVDEAGLIAAKPARWKVVEVWSTILPLLGMVSGSLALTIIFFHFNGELGAALVIRSQIALIHCVLSGRLVHFILHTDGKHVDNRQLLLFTTMVPMIVTALCCWGFFGGDRQITAKEAVLTCVATLVPFSFTILRYRHTNAAAEQGRWAPRLERDDAKGE